MYQYNIDYQQIRTAVQLLCDGKAIAIPTETVYGLAADAMNEAAIVNVFKLKGRPVDHPVITHIANASQLTSWAIDIPDVAYRLAEAFWPGPLTFILKRAPQVLNIVTGGQETIGLRSPNHPLTHALLKAFDGGLIAPSANRFGEVSPTTAQHVREIFGDEIDLILEGGPCQIGVESTILDLTHDEPRILRPGMITPSMIEAVLQQKVLLPKTLDKNIPRVSGSLPKHYAPKTRLLLVESDRLAETIKTLSKEKNVGVLSFMKQSFSIANWHTLPNEPNIYAKQLYQTLHELDVSNVELIIVELPPNNEAWLAIQDRLQRAATQ